MLIDFGVTFLFDAHTKSVTSKLKNIQLFLFFFSMTLYPKAPLFSSLFPCYSIPLYHFKLLVLYMDHRTLDKVKSCVVTQLLASYCWMLILYSNGLNPYLNKSTCCRLKFPFPLFLLILSGRRSKSYPTKYLKECNEMCIIPDQNWLERYVV